MLRRVRRLCDRRWSSPIAMRTSQAKAVHEGQHSDYAVARHLKRMVGDRHGADRRRYLSRALLPRMREMEAAGAPLGTRAYGIAMGLAASEGMSRLCDALYARMREKNLPADVGIYNMLMKAHRIHGAYASVCFYWNLLNTTPPLRPDIISHTEYIKASLGAVPFARVQEMLAAAEAVCTTTPQRLALYTAVVAGLPPGESEAMHREVVTAGLPVDLAYHTARLAAACRPPGDELLAERVMREVHRDKALKPDLRYLNTVLKLYHTTGNFAKVCAAIKLVEHYGLVPNITTFNLAITACTAEARGRADHPAVRFASLLYHAAVHRGLGCYPTLYCAMVDLYRSIHDIRGLRQVRDAAATAGHVHDGSKLGVLLAECAHLLDGTGADAADVAEPEE